MSRTYSVILSGEGGVTFKVEGWRRLTLEQAASVLGPVTGYRSDFLRDDIRKRMRASRLGVCEIRPAACSWGEAPAFLVSRDDNRKDPLEEATG